MEIVKVVSFGIVGTLLGICLGKETGEYRFFITVTTGIFILAVAVGYIAPIIEVVQTYAQKAQVNAYNIQCIFKILGVSYLAQFGADICKDAGQQSIATKIELAARLIIVYLSLPIVISLFDYLGEML